MADETYKIKVETHGDPSGSAAVRESLERTTDATKKHGDSNKQAADLIDQFGRKGQAARDVTEGLTIMLEGRGVSALLGFAKAAANAREAIGISGLGLGVGVLLGLGPKLIEWAGQAAEGFKQTGESAEETKTKFESARTAGEALGDLKFDALKTELTTLKTEAQALATHIDRIEKWRQKIDDARKNVDLAEIEASDLDPEAKKQEKARIEQAAADKKAKDDKEQRDKRVSEGYDVAARTSEKSDAATAEVARQRKRIDDANAENDRIDQLKRERDQLGAIPGEDLTPEVMQRRRQIDEELKRASPTSPEALGYMRGRLNKAESAAAAAEAAANEAAAEAAKRAQDASVDEANANRLKALEDKRRRLEAGLPEPTPRTNPPSTITEPGRINIGGKDYDASGRIGSPPIEINGVRRATTDLSQAAKETAATVKEIGAHIEIAGREWEATRRELATIRNQLRANGRQGN
ncbi:MAG: hypothetical protein HZA93_23890 [Verrucomicrobia bacterium]|nr:hypothetical protein [Verrucomicrobiota bacterium]